MKDQERVSKIIDALAPELKTLALNIHDNPELGLQEFKACAWQKELLAKYGFQIEDDFCNLETAYKAVYKGKKQGPKIAFLAEYDALPGLGHGCGHNLIAMVAVGCGIACREFADEYGAEIDVIGTPAEETAGTKVPMSAMGVFKDYDAVMMAHPAFANAESMNTIAMDAYKIEFFGKPAHAASAPHEGINALDAMINFFNLINAMRQETKPDARIHGVITDGAFVGVTGAAGSGKSTLTYAINGIIPHCYPGDFYGSVRVDGVDTCEASLTDISRLVGSVCQDIDSQMVSSVVEDEVLYGLENFGVPKAEIPARVDEALAAMGITDLRDRSIAELSGGQKQKVAVASVLALKPRVLVLDEPTAELDPASSVAVFDLLKRYSVEHGTVIVVEQKFALLSEYADTLIIVDEGEIRFCGTPHEVLEHSDELLEIGVNCPRSTSLVNRLRARGLVCGPAVCTVEGAVCACEGLLSGKEACA